MRSEYKLSVYALAIWCLIGCTIQREPAQSPFASDAELNGIEAADASGGAGGRGGSAGAGGTGQASGGAPAQSTGGGSDEPPAGTGGAGGTQSSGAGGAAGDPQEVDAAVAFDAGESFAPVVEGCNPVSNDGCPPAMQCAIDVLAPTLTGYCTFSSPMTAGLECFNSGVTESCLPKQTCFDFECRTLCFCDADCEEGECCVDPIGDLGFKACGAC
jgi:hypothetical protein